MSKIATANHNAQGVFVFGSKGFLSWHSRVTIASFLSLLLGLTAADFPGGASLAQELTDLHRGLHPRCLGYLDVGQIQDLRSQDRAEHQAYGDLRGFQEVRRATGVFMGPDSAADLRYGLMGTWQAGGWAKDVYLTSAPDLNRSQTRWGGGVAAGRISGQWFTAGGWIHVDPTEWEDDRGYRTADGGDAFWALGRFRRFGAVVAAGVDGPDFARAGLLVDPAPFAKYSKNWYWPQLEVAANYHRASWNPWSDQDEVGAEVRMGLLGERVAGRLEAGQDGFRLAQVQSNLDPEGNVGVDISWSRRRDGDGPGIRLRVPFLTFSWNDPDDIAAFGVSRRGVVWSLRLLMTWETSQGWYRPGRRLSGGGSE